MLSTMCDVRYSLLLLTENRKVRIGNFVLSGADQKRFCRKEYVFGSCLIKWFTELDDLAQYTYNTDSIWWHIQWFHILHLLLPKTKSAYGKAAKLMVNFRRNRNHSVDQMAKVYSFCYFLSRLVSHGNALSWSQHIIFYRCYSKSNNKFFFPNRLQFQLNEWHRNRMVQHTERFLFTKNIKIMFHAIVMLIFSGQSSTLYVSFMAFIH